MKLIGKEHLPAELSVNAELIINLKTAKQTGRGLLPRVSYDACREGSAESPNFLIRYVDQYLIDSKSLVITFSA